MTNWTAEKDKLENKGIWFNPDIGTDHAIEILEEVDDTYRFDTEWKGQVRKKIRIPIRTGNQEQNWGVGIGKTPQSLYGQLVFLFEHWQSNNQPIKGQVINLEVTAEDELATKKKRRFRIREAVALIAQTEKPTPQTDKAKADFQTEQPPTIKSQAVETEGA